MDIRVATGSVTPSRLLGTNQSNKVNIPVAPHISPYAQYKYVRGVPTYNRQRAVPVTKLRMLNNIIDSLQGLKEQRQIEIKPQKEGISDETLDAMIDLFSEKLHQAIKQTPPSFGGEGASTGMAFNMAV